MKKKDVKLRINEILWEKALEKLKLMFGRSYCVADAVLILLLLAFYKLRQRSHFLDDIYIVADHPSDFDEENYIEKTISVYAELFKALCPDDNVKLDNSSIFQIVLTDFLRLPFTFYTDCISPLYTIVGSKNHTMQEATANAVDAMKLDTVNMLLVDGCCATGALFFGLKDYDWREVRLNDLNPLRTNFLNVLKLQPLKLIKKLLEMDLSFIERPETKKPKIKEFKEKTQAYAEKRRNYHRVDCNIAIAAEMFLLQCIDKAIVEQSDRIFQRILRFLPAHLKLQNAIITQEDCLEYLDNDVAKLVLLDVPYIGTEKECAVGGYHYEPFHAKVAKLLQQAKYPFIYFCRSSAPKSNKHRPQHEKEKIMKMKLGIHFWNKGFYFQKVRLKEDTELLVSNRLYNAKEQFQWDDFDTDIL